MLVIVAASWLLLLDHGSGDVAAGPPAVTGPAGPVSPDGLPELSPPADRAGPAEGAGEELGRVAHTASRPEPHAPSVTSSLTGRVVDPAGRPLAGARVLALGGSALRRMPLDSDAFDEPRWSDRRRETESGTDGRFELTGLKASTHRLAVRAPGYGPLDVEGLELPVGGTRDAGDLRLGLGVVLSGRVIDSDGAGIAGVKLRHLDEPGNLMFLTAGTVRGRPAATSAADGSFRVDVLDPGPWRLLVLSEEHPDLQVEGRAPEAGREYGGQLFQLTAAWSVQGRVVAGEELDPTTLAVRASPLGVQRFDLGGGPREWREAACDAEGSFIVRGLERGVDYRLRVREGGDKTWNVDWLSDPVEIVEGAHGVRLEVSSSSSVRLTVLDADGPAPLEDFDVELTVHTGTSTQQHAFAVPGSEEEVTRDAATGALEIGGLRRVAPGSTVDVIVRAETYATLEREGLALVPGGSADLGTFALVRHPGLTVRVVDDESGEPLAGAQAFLSAGADREVRARLASVDEGSFHVESYDQSLETDEQGLARFRKPADRPGSIWARHAERAPSERVPVPATVGPAQLFELRLGPGGLVEVRVLDSSGRPAHGVPVRRGLVSNEGEDAHENTDQAGRAVFEHVQPGRHEFEVQAPRSGPFAGLMTALEPQANASSRAELTVRAGERHELTLEAPPQGGLEGRVTEAGRPLAGARLFLEAPGQSNPLRSLGGFFGDAPATTGADGSYDLGEHPAGPYELVIAHPARAMNARVALELPPGGRTLDVDLSLTMVEGRVVDGQGRGLEGVELRATPAGEDPERDDHLVTFSMGSDEDDTFQIELGGNQESVSRSGPDGRYQLRGLRPGIELAIHARSDEHLPGMRAPLTLEPGELRTGVDLELAPAGTIEVRARRRDGTLLRVFEALAVDLSTDPAQQREGRADRSGRARLTSLRPGRWSLSIRAGDDPPAPGREVEVQAGEVTAVEIAVP